MDTAIWLILIGLFLGPGVLVAEISNIRRAWNNTVKENGNFFSFAGQVLKGHLASMVVMALGAIMIIIGLEMLAMRYLG